MTKREYNQRYYAKNKERLKLESRMYASRNKEKILESARRYYYENRERNLAVKAEYGRKNRAKLSEKGRAYYQKNKAILYEKNKIWRQKNRERVNRKNREYWAKNPEKFNAWREKWRKKNPCKLKAYDNRRRAIEKKATVDGVAAQWFYEIIHNQDFLTCAYCLKKITPKQAHVDHIIPLSRGGEHGPNNFCVSCEWCNFSKNDSLISEWKKCPDRVKELQLN